MIDPDLIEKCEIFDGDFMDVMEDIKPNSVDCIMGSLRNSDGFSDDMTIRYFKLLKRILKDAGSIIMGHWIHDMPSTYKNSIGVKIAEDVGLVRQHDMTYFHYTKNDKFHRKYNSPNKPIYEKKDNNFIFQKTVNGKSFTLEQSTPSLHMDLVASTYVPPNGILLNPACGDGTELIAALQRNKRAMGIDVDIYAVDYTRERIRRYLEYGCVRKPACYAV